MTSLRSAISPVRCATVALPYACMALLVISTVSCDAGKKGAGVDLSKIAENKDCQPQPGKTAASVAVGDFIKTTEPKPMRFLSAAGTDSAISDDGMLAMQDKGPTYFYAGKDTQLKAVRDKLELAGPYTALLVVSRGETKNTDGTRTIRLGGHFVTGEYDGKAAKSETYTMSCDQNGWKVASKKDEAGS